MRPTMYKLPIEPNLNKPTTGTWFAWVRGLPDYSTKYDIWLIKILNMTDTESDMIMQKGSQIPFLAVSHQLLHKNTPNPLDNELSFEFIDGWTRHIKKYAFVHHDKDKMFQLIDFFSDFFTPYSKQVIWFFWPFSSFGWKLMTTIVGVNVFIF